MNRSCIFILLVLFVTHFESLESSDPNSSNLNSSENSKPTQKELFDSVLEEFINSKKSEGVKISFNSDDEKIASKFRYQPSQNDKLIFERALQKAPSKVKSILKIEKNLDKVSSLRSNWLLLVGEPGTGKSTLAKAMALELGNCYFVTSGDLFQQYRNATSQRLNEIIGAISRLPGKSILIIDEMNKLVEHYTSEGRDSGDTASTLWEKMDENKLNPNFFIIGTANDSKKMPPQLQDRFRHAFLKISSPDSQDRQQLIIDFLGNLKIPIDTPILNNIDSFVKKTNKYNVRSIERLFEAAVRFAYESDRPILTLECCEKAFKEREDDGREFCDFSPSLLDEERRHQELLMHSKSQFEENNKSMRQQRNESRVITALNWIFTYCLSTKS